MDLAKLHVHRVDGYEIEYLSMRKAQVYESDESDSDSESSTSSDTSSGSSGGDYDLPEDNLGYESDWSEDSDKTIGYDMDSYQANVPGCSKSMAIIIDEETQDVPIDLQVPEEDLIDLTRGMDLSEKKWNLHIPPNFAANLREVVESRKRKANEEDSFNHPLIEFEAQGKELLLYLFIYRLP